MNQLIYRHRRKDNNQVFYIGCSGNNERPFDFVRRTNAWLDVFNSTDVSVEIIEQGLEKEDALELERIIINSYDNLVNMYGNGYTSWNDGKKLSKEHKARLKANSGQAKKVRCTKTNKIFNSVTEASNSIKYSRGHLKNMLKGIRTNKTSLVWA